MRLHNPSEVDIDNYSVNKEKYTIKAGQTVTIDDQAGQYLRKIYGFLIEVKDTKSEQAGEKKKAN